MVHEPCLLFQRPDPPEMEHLYDQYPPGLLKWWNHLVGDLSYQPTFTLNRDLWNALVFPAQLGPVLFTHVAFAPIPDIHIYHVIGRNLEPLKVRLCAVGTALISTSANHKFHYAVDTERSLRTELVPVYLARQFIIDVCAQRYPLHAMSAIRQGEMK